MEEFKKKKKGKKAPAGEDSLGMLPALALLALKLLDVSINTHLATQTSDTHASVAVVGRVVVQGCV